MDTNELVTYIPKGFESKPTTVLETLQATKALLQEEGRWTQGLWFVNNHPDVDPQDPFCSSWQVCLAGAVGVVAHGCEPHAHPLAVAAAPWRYSWVEAEEHSSLVKETLRVLERQLPHFQLPYDYVTNAPIDDPYLAEEADHEVAAGIPDFNDHPLTTRDDVIALVNKAIESLQDL